MKRLLLVVTLNLFAVAAPAFGLAVAFGGESVDPQSVKHLLALAGCGIFAFIVGSVAARIGSEGALSPFDVVEITVRESKAPTESAN